jgi:hypothetical protein
MADRMSDIEAEWMKKKLVIILSVLAVCSVYFYRATARPPKNEWASTGDCVSQTISHWLKEDNSKLENSKTCSDIQLGSYTRLSPTAVKDALKTIPVNALANAGLPTADEWKKMSGGIGYVEFKTFTLQGESLVAADTGNLKDHDDEALDIYIKENNHYEQILHLLGYCRSIEIFPPGKDWPTFILTNISGCGSGWTAKFYQLNASRRLELKLKMGGWQADTRYGLIDGALTVINSSATTVFPGGLLEQLKQCNGFDRAKLTGPQFTEVAVSKWIKNEFVTFCNFTVHGEWWVER